MTTDPTVRYLMAAPGPAEQDNGGAGLVPNPGHPMAVARELLPAWTYEGLPTLRHWRGTWMRWQRTHWAEVDAAEVRAFAYKELEHAEFEAVTPKGETEMRPWSPTKKKISDLMEAMGAITILPASVDAPEWIAGRAAAAGPVVACTNGLLDVPTLDLGPLTPGFFNLVSVPFDYVPGAPVPERWLSFLAQIWPEDAEQIAALQEFFGYVISGRTDLHKILLIIGPPRSGKGTIARVLTALVGKGNMAGPTLASLATNFGLSPLLGKPLAIISDARLGGRDSHQVVERLLTISGEDTIDVDRKFRDPWTGRLSTRFLILSNELPNFGDASGAIATRFVVLTMTASWLGREDTGLMQALYAELPGILNWGLEGLARLTGQGRFTEPESSRDAVTSMQDTASPMSAFIRECCTKGPGAQVEVDRLYGAWRQWCLDNGRDKPGTKQMFGRNLQAAVPQVKTARPRAGATRVRVYEGIALDECWADNGEHRGPSRTTYGDQGFYGDQSWDHPGPASEPPAGWSAMGPETGPVTPQVKDVVRDGPRQTPLSAQHSLSAEAGSVDPRAGWWVRSAPQGTGKCPTCGTHGPLYRLPVQGARTAWCGSCLPGRLAASGRLSGNPRCAACGNALDPALAAGEHVHPGCDTAQPDHRTDTASAEQSPDAPLCAVCGLPMTWLATPHQTMHPMCEPAA